MGYYEKTAVHCSCSRLAALNDAPWTLILSSCNDCNAKLPTVFKVAPSQFTASLQNVNLLILRMMTWALLIKKQVYNKMVKKNALHKLIMYLT